MPNRVGQDLLLTMKRAAFVLKPFLGSYLLGEAIDSAPTALAPHGHAHAVFELDTGLRTGPAGYGPGMNTTWKPHQAHGALRTAEKNDLPESVFAFPGKRKEPLTDADHVRNALARFDQVTDVTDAERDQAFANILAAAKHYGVDVAEASWRELGKQPHTANPAKAGER